MTTSDFRVRVTGLVFFLSRHLSSRSKSQTAFENLRQIPLISQLSFYIGYFWPFQMVLGCFLIVLGCFRSFQVVLGRFRSFQLVPDFSKYPDMLYNGHLVIADTFLRNRSSHCQTLIEKLYIAETFIAKICYSGHFF